MKMANFKCGHLKRKTTFMGHPIVVAFHGTLAHGLIFFPSPTQIQLESTAFNGTQVQIALHPETTDETDSIESIYRRRMLLTDFYSSPAILDLGVQNRTPGIEWRCPSSCHNSSAERNT